MQCLWWHHQQRTAEKQMRWCQLTICMMQSSEFSYYKIKQINNKANHLLEFEYTLLGSTSTCTRTCTWNSVLVLVNFASTCTCTRRVSEYLYLYTVYLWHHRNSLHCKQTINWSHTARQPQALPYTQFRCLIRPSPTFQLINSCEHHKTVYT